MRLNNAKDETKSVSYTQDEIDMSKNSNPVNEINIFKECVQCSGWDQERVRYWGWNWFAQLFKSSGWMRLIFSKSASNTQDETKSESDTQDEIDLPKKSNSLNEIDIFKE